MDIELTNQETSTTPDTGDGDLVETIEMRPQEPSEPKGDEKAPEAEKDGEKPAENGEEPKAEEDEGEKDEKGREKFIPRERFDEVNEVAKKVPTLEKELANLKGQVEVLSKQQPAKQKDQEPDFLDEISNMSPDDLRDQFDENPAEFLKKRDDALMARWEQRVSQKSTEQDLNTRITTSLASFAKENEGFDELWSSGKIHELMDENPIHSPISAFQALTKETREAAIQKQIDEAVSKAVKETEAKFNKLLKRENSSLPGGPAATSGGGAPPELNDTTKYGGLVRTIANRVNAMRQA